MKEGIVVKEMYENTKLFILNNYNGVLDENILDILTVSFMSLFIRFPYVTKDKMPYVLNKLEMFFDNKTVLKMVTSKYPTYPTKNICLPN